MKEFKFIEFLKPLSIPPVGGIGDDAALYGDNLIAADLLVEGTHFLSNANIDEVMNHLFASNVSDIAAMGGKKNKYKALLCVALPDNCDKVKFIKALTKMAIKYDMELTGGDTATSKHGLFMSLTIIGKRGINVLSRAGATEKDIVYVSRSLGASKYALLRKTGKLEQYADIEYKFAPESALGELLGELDGVTSCIDISDGLGQDVSHIADSSKVRIILDSECIPIAEIPIEEDVKLDYALSSGEEYALAFTVSAHKAFDIEKAIYHKLGRSVYKVGTVDAGEGCFLRLSSGELRDISQFGYEHE